MSAPRRSAPSTCSRRWFCCSWSSVHTYTLYDKVVSTRADHVLTFDLRLPTWPFFAVAWFGDVAAVILVAIRTYRLIFHPELLARSSQIQQVE